MSGNDSDGGGAGSFRTQEKIAARAARFNNRLQGNRYRELEAPRAAEREAWIQNGGDRIEMRGTCEGMCAEYEMEFRDFTSDIHPLEARADDRKRIDHSKAVAAYTRSDAGAGHGEAAKLPSDLRTPAALVRSVDYLFDSILPTPPPGRPDATARMALGFTTGFIRDRTRAIRKEFAMQSIWGHQEAIASFERIARWHILCLRELQEQSGVTADMHNDAQELGKCFISLRQHYNDMREEAGVDMPCPNEPEFRAYMLIFDLTQRGTATACAEVPAVILDHPNVKLAWRLRRTAQRNFDSQKEGSKQNAEYGSNLITAYIRLLKTAQVPFLLSCLAEIRLRELRRSALRAMQMSYLRPKDADISRTAIPLGTLASILGCEEQENEPSAWEDVVDVVKDPEAEAASVAQAFGLQIHMENGKPSGVYMARSLPFNDNNDAPYTRRWALITARQAGASYGDVINGKAGILSDPSAPAPQVAPRARTSMGPKPPLPPRVGPAFGNRTASGGFGFGGMVELGQRKPPPTQGGLGLSFKSPSVEPNPKQVQPPTLSAFGGGKSAFGGAGKTGGFGGLGGSTAGGSSTTGGPRGSGAFGGFGGSSGATAIGAPSGPTGFSGFGGFGKGAAADKTPVKATGAEETTTPKATPPAQPVFRVPAVPEHRKITQSGAVPPEKSAAASSTTFSFGAKPAEELAASSSAKETASTLTFTFNKPSVPAEQTAVINETKPTSSGKESDIEGILAQPSFFGTAKPSSEPAAPAVESSTSVAAISTAPQVSSEPVDKGKAPAFGFASPAPQTSSAAATPVIAPPAITTDAVRPASTMTALTPQLRTSLSRSVRSRPSANPIKMPDGSVESAIDTLVDSLITDTISNLLDKHRPELGDYVKTQSIIKDYQRQLAQREKNIKDWSAAILEQIVREDVEAMCRDVVDEELEEREEDRAAAEEKRQIEEQRAEEAHRLSDSIRKMGFGGQSIILTPKAPQWGYAKLPAGSDYGSPSVNGRDNISKFEVDFDFDLHKAHEKTATFYAPASFLRAIGQQAQHLTSALQGIDPDFNVLVSLSTDSTVSSGKEALEWLASKLSPPDDDDELEVSGVTLASQVIGRYDNAELGNVGVYVFEAPLPGDDRDKDRTTADSQDRLHAMVKHARAARYKSPYPAVLIIATWIDESLDNLVQRLDIVEDIAYFDQNALVSLQEIESLDQRFSASAGEVLDVAPKSQLCVPLDLLVPDVMPQWLRLLSTIGTSIRNNASDVKLAAECLVKGIEALGYVHQAIGRAARGKKIESNNSYDAFTLPAMNQNRLNTESAITFVESLEPYFGDQLFAGLNDVHLCLAHLRDAALGKQCLPVAQLLAALGGLILGEMAEQTMCFRYYDTPEGIRKERAAFAQLATGAFRVCVDGMIGKIGSAVPAASPAKTHAARADRVPTTTTEKDIFSRSPGIGFTRQSLKRHVSSDTLSDASPATARARGSKKARHDRLLEAIKAAQETIRDMVAKNEDEGDSMDVDDLGVGGVSIFAQ